MKETLCQSTGFYCCLIYLVLYKLVKVLVHMLFWNWYLLEVQIHLSHAHQTRFWYLSGCFATFSDEPPRRVYMIVLPPIPPPPPPLSLKGVKLVWSSLQSFLRPSRKGKNVTRCHNSSHDTPKESCEQDYTSFTLLNRSKFSVRNPLTPREFAEDENLKPLMHFLTAV